MTYPNSENKFKAAIGLLAAAGAFFTTGGAAGSAWAALAGSLCGEVAGEKLDHFLKKGYDAICGNKAAQPPLEQAAQEALAAAVKDITREWEQQNPTLTKADKKNTKAFLQLFEATAPAQLYSGFFETALQAELSALLEQHSPARELDSLFHQQAFLDYFGRQYQLPPAFTVFFTAGLAGHFTRRFREIIAAGGPAKNTLDLLYQQTSKALLADLLEQAGGTNEKLHLLQQTVDELRPVLGNAGTEQAIALAVKQAIAAQQDTLLEHLNPQPRLEYQWGRQADNDAVFRQRYLDFVVPPRAWQQLWDFYNKDSLLEWWMVTGPAGTGKSRLALEFCIALHQQSPQPVSAGFIGSDVLEAYNWWQHLPQRPWFIVIDYAGSRRAAVQKALEGLRVALHTGKLQHKVRLLLLERSLPADFAESNSSKLYLHLPGGSLHAFADSPLALAAADAEDTIRLAAAVFQDTFNKAGKALSHEALGAYLLATVKIDPLLRPLFVFFCARAAAGGQDIRNWNREELLQDWLNKHEYPRWRLLLPHGADEAALQPWLNLLTIATMLYGFTEAQATALYHTAPAALLPQPP